MKLTKEIRLLIPGFSLILNTFSLHPAVDFFRKCHFLMNLALFSVEKSRNSKEKIKHLKRIDKFYFETAEFEVFHENFL